MFGFPPDGIRSGRRRRSPYCRRDGALVINTIVWSELAPLIATEPALRKAVETLKMERELLPWETAFLAGVTHSRYRRAGGLARTNACRICLLEPMRSSLSIVC